MGWYSGSSILNDLIPVMKAEMPSDFSRQRVYTILINAFEQMDWDTQVENLGQDKAYDAALKAIHPEWFDENDDFTY